MPHVRQFARRTAPSGRGLRNLHGVANDRATATPHCSPATAAPAQHTTSALRLGGHLCVQRVGDGSLSSRHQSSTHARLMVGRTWREPSTSFSVRTRRVTVTRRSRSACGRIRPGPDDRRLPAPGNWSETPVESGPCCGSPTSRGARASGKSRMTPPSCEDTPPGSAPAPRAFSPVRCKIRAASDSS